MQLTKQWSSHKVEFRKIGKGFRMMPVDQVNLFLGANKILAPGK